MKKLYSVSGAIMALGFMLTAVACGNSSDGDIDPPGPVTDVSAVTALGKVTLKWKAPADQAYQYTRIDYKHPVEGTPTYSLVGKYTSEADENGFYSLVITDYEVVSEQEYVLTACGFSEEASAPVTVKATIQAPSDKPYKVVAETIAMTGDVDGVSLSWRNDMDIPVVVSVEFTGYDGKTVAVENISSTDGAMRVGSINPANNPQNIKVRVFNRSKTRSSEESTLPLDGVTITSGAKLDVSSWSVSEASATWNQGDQWLAKNLIDGKPTTAWHTEPSGASPYPYHAVMDMGGEYVISSVDLWPRSDDHKGGPTKIGFEISEDAETWFSAGTFDFDNTTASSQKFYLNQTLVSVRYLKLLLLEGPLPYSMMGELVPYGAKRD